MITKQIAITARNFEHVTVKNKDGTPARCRAMGKCKVWKTRPDEFKLPVVNYTITEDKFANLLGKGIRGEIKQGFDEMTQGGW